MKLSLISYSILSTIITLPEVSFAGDASTPFTWDGFYAGITGGYGKLENKGSLSTKQCVSGTTSITPNVTNTTIIPDVTNTTIVIDESWGITDTTTNIITGTTSTNIIDGTTTVIPGTVISDYVNFNPQDESWFLGGEAGYNKQIGAILLGGILDISGANYNVHHTDIARGVSISTDLNWFSTLRLRAGIPMNQFLIYGTAGLAIGNFDVHYRSGVGLWSESYTEPGWAAGAGVSYAFNKKWAADLSYVHLDFNSTSQIMGAARIKTDLSADLLKIGLNYRF